MNDLEETLGERLRRARLRRKTTLAREASLIGVSVNQLCQYERNKCEPRIKFIVRAAEHYDLDIHWLLTGDQWEPKG